MTARINNLFFAAAIVVAPTIYLANLLLAYAIARWVCATGHVYAFHALSAVGLLLVVAPIAFVWVGGGRASDGSETPTGTDRSRFLAPIAVGSTFLFALATLLQWLAQLILDPCMT